MEKNRSKLNDWLDGELSYPLKTDRRDPQEKKRSARSDNHKNKHIPSQQTALLRFLLRYRALVVTIGMILLAALLLTIFRMPPFGDDSNPSNNEVVERYVSRSVEETGAENVIAGMILNYRGFDTFGESCVLFLAASCVCMLLGRDKHSFTDSDLKAFEQEEAASEKDLILSTMSRLLIPCILLFGICMLFNGHVSPGGGFSGGSVLGASVILFTVAFGVRETGRFLSERVYNIVRVSGLCIYGIMFGIYIFLGANAIESSLSRYIVSVIDIAVGLVVMTTMYGFYSYYTKGAL